MKLDESFLTQEYVRECFTYNKAGILTWNIRPESHFNNEADAKRFNSQWSGKVAGYFNKRTDSKREGFGYYRVRITDHAIKGHFKSHRIVWLYHKGYLPKVVDHINRDTRDNRIENLRESDEQTNSYNTNINVNNTTGFMGVSKSNDSKRKNKPYKSCIYCKNRAFFLGFYSDAEMAGLAYNIASETLFGEFASFNKVNLTKDQFVTKSKFFKGDLPKLIDGTFDWISKKERGSKND